MKSIQEFGRIALLALFGLGNVLPALAQHQHGDAQKVKAPRVFLDKSPRIVAYQLGRLSNEQLLAIETRTDDKKFLPVFSAILTREGMSRAYREDALEAMITINGSNAVAELTAALTSVEQTAASASRTIATLAKMLLSRPASELAAAEAQLKDLTQLDSPLLTPVGFGALFVSGSSKTAWAIANSEVQKVNLLHSVALIPAADVRSELHAEVLALTGSESTKVANAAIEALAHVPTRQDESFTNVADFVEVDDLRDAAVKTLLSVPKDLRDASKSEELIQYFVEFAENTAPDQRTQESFLDAMQLVDELLAGVPSEMAKSYRARLRETVVRVVRIHTVEEEMRYDVPYFAVEAGRPVQVVLINEDLMPHNLVFTQPGALKEVAEAGLAAGPTGGLDGKQYVPKSDKVLHATNMIGSLESEAITFDAPTEPGEYPYVCTFPRHWMRMYGVMVVVEDLDAWLKDPVEPKDPIGSNRSFVQSWKIEDFEGNLAAQLRGRSAQIGERIFTEATCAQCHRAGAIGIGNVGPELSQTFAKFKGDTKAVLQEIIDPSHRIDDKYAVHLILDLDDQTYSGLVVSEDKEKVLLLENPEAKEPTTILKEDIEQMVKTSNSMMPKGLLDRFSQDEIFELLGFLLSVQKP